MSFLLHIDTAVQTASVCLSKEQEVLGLLVNEDQKDHASWLHVAIHSLLKDNHLLPSLLSGVSVSAGPGSYTGLRVGLSAAKGLCYALNIPLFALNTLEVMASSALTEEEGLLCPMIDARRREVFTAVFDRQLKEVLPTQNMILESDSFSTLLNKDAVLFFGNGSEKFSTLTQHPNARFRVVLTTAKHLVPLAWNLYLERNSADLAYCIPNYTKDFHSATKQS